MVFFIWKTSTHLSSIKYCIKHLKALFLSCTKKEQGFPLLFPQFFSSFITLQQFFLIKTWTTNSPHGWYGATPITINDVTFLPWGKSMSQLQAWSVFNQGDVDVFLDQYTPSPLRCYHCSKLSFKQNQTRDIKHV